VGMASARAGRRLSHAAAGGLPRDDGPATETIVAGVSESGSLPRSRRLSRPPTTPLQPAAQQPARSRRSVGKRGPYSSRPDHNKLISTKCLREASADGCWRWLHVHRVEPQEVHRLKQRLRQRPAGVRRSFPERRQVAQEVDRLRRVEAFVFCPTPRAPLRSASSSRTGRPSGAPRVVCVPREMLVTQTADSRPL
jgi:hypothetical protein